MGVDAVVWSHVEEPVAAQIEELRERLEQVDGRCAEFIHRESYFIIPGRFSDWSGPMGMHWKCPYRYWAPGYERGSWPPIAGAIEAFRAVFGHVYYHGDHVEYAREFTLADAAEYWEHWRSPQWDAYHRNWP
jgi:hypothetical protein